MSWIAEKLKKDTEDMSIRAMPGDTDTLKDMDWLLRHQGEVKSITEAREKRLAEDREIERRAAQERKEKDEARVAAIVAEREAYAISQFNNHIVVTIAGRRLNKMSGWQDLKCDKCGSPLYKARGLVMTAADIHRRSANTGGEYPNAVQRDAAKCSECSTVNPIMVQVVW